MLTVGLYLSVGFDFEWLSLTRFVDFLCPCPCRCLGRPELQCFWSAVVVLSAGKCDGAPQHIQLQHGPGPRQVRLLRRLGVGRQLQHLHRRQFHPQEKRTAETGEEGLDASRSVSPPLFSALSQIDKQERVCQPSPRTPLTSFATMRVMQTPCNH